MATTKAKEMVTILNTEKRLDVITALKVLGGLIKRCTVDENTLTDLVVLKLGRHDHDILHNNRPVFLLTPFGKQVVKALA